MIKIKCTFINGEFEIMCFKGTLEEAKQTYFGRIIDVENVMNRGQRCICVHPA